MGSDGDKGKSRRDVAPKIWPNFVWPVGMGTVLFIFKVLHQTAVAIVALLIVAAFNLWLISRGRANIRRAQARSRNLVVRNHEERDH